MVVETEENNNYDLDDAEDISEGTVMQFFTKQLTLYANYRN